MKVKVFGELYSIKCY